MSDKVKLTTRQELFCQNYVNLGNASEACRLAKYSPKNANVTGSNLMSKSYIRERIAELREFESDTQQADIDRAQAVLWAIADDKTATNSAKTQAVTELARQSGWHSERLIIEEQQPRINYINSKQLITNMQVNIAIAEPVEDLRLLGGG